MKAKSLKNVTSSSRVTSAVTLGSYETSKPCNFAITCDKKTDSTD